MTVAVMDCRFSKCENGNTFQTQVYKTINDASKYQISHCVTLCIAVNHDSNNTLSLLTKPPSGCSLAQNVNMTHVN